MLKTALAILLVTTGFGMHSTYRVTGRTPENTTHLDYPQATVSWGNVRVTLMTPATGIGVHRLILRLEGDTRPLSNRPVFITVSRLLRHPGKPRPMRHSGDGYQADVRIAQDGTWEVVVQLQDVSGRVHLVPFLVRVVSGRSTHVWSVYALFVPVNGWSPTISFPLGPYVANVSATIAPFGQTTFRIQLTPQAHLPSRLRLELTMLDMEMGHTFATASGSGRGVYRAQAFFSMPGAWSVAIVAGRQSTAAALIVGERTQEAKGNL